MFDNLILSFWPPAPASFVLSTTDRLAEHFSSGA